MNRKTMKKIIGLCCATLLLSSCHIYKSYDRPESIDASGIYRDPAAAAVHQRPGQQLYLSRPGSS